MSLTSTIGGLPYPALGDVPNIQTAGSALTAAVDLVTLPKFATDASVTAAIPSPTAGQRICRTDVGYAGAVAVWSAILSRWVYEPALITETTVGSDSATISLTSIPQKWNHLKLIINGRAGATTSIHKHGMEVFASFNSDTTNTNYSSTDNTRMDRLISSVLQYNISTITGAATGNTSAAIVSVSATGFGGDIGARLGDLPGESTGAAMWGTIDADIYGYSSITSSKPVSVASKGGASIGGGGAEWLTVDCRSSWAGTSPITSITLGMFTTGTFKAGTTVRMYGIS